MGRTFEDSGTLEPRLSAALRRLDGLVDWERRDRSGGSGRVMRVDLGPAADLCRRLDHPERAWHAVHVAGSKGKGSTAALVAAGLRRAGLRVGLYTSPHVERIHERIVVAGAPIDDGALAAALEAALAAREGALEEDSAGARATWFDVLTCAALEAFRRAGVAWAVVECGLGGRLDSTNVVRPRLTVLTAIEREHAAILGDTVALIAGEKAGILAPGVPAVSACADLRSEAGRALRASADRLRVSLVDVPAARRGPLEERNRALAAAALERLGVGSAGLRDAAGRPLGAALLDGEAVRAARLPGRLERREAGGVPLVLDGAHVPASLALVLEELRGSSGLSGPGTAVLGCGRDKDVAGLLKTLAGRVDRVVCTTVGPGPYRSPDELVAAARPLGLAAEAEEDPARALELALAAARARGGWVLVTGSLHLVGALRSRTHAHPC